jgi:hypothetical protein
MIEMRLHDGPAELSRTGDKVVCRSFAVGTESCVFSKSGKLVKWVVFAEGHRILRV